MNQFFYATHKSAAKLLHCRICFIAMLMKWSSNFLKSRSSLYFRLEVIFPSTNNLTRSLPVRRRLRYNCLTCAMELKNSLMSIFPTLLCTTHFLFSSFSFLSYIWSKDRFSILFLLLFRLGRTNSDSIKSMLLEWNTKELWSFGMNQFDSKTIW